MKIPYDMNPPINIRNLLLRIGYHQHYDSYVSPLGGGHYPRFHIYIKEKKDNTIILNLHLDQKKPSYKGFKAHMGEADSDVVQEEASRVKRWLDYAKITKGKL